MTDPDVAAGLTELERKLEALEQELQGSRRAMPAGAPSNGGDRHGSNGGDHHGSGGLRISAAASSGPVALAAAPEPEPPTTHTAPAAAGDVPPRPPQDVVAPPAPPAPTPPAAAPPPDAVTRLVADARDELGGLHSHLDELERFREQLERSAQELIAEYDRLLTGLRAVAEQEQAVRPASTGLDGIVLDGMLTVDAGPFEDIAALAELEQSLGGLPGVRDVHVRTFERSHALIDVILGEPVAFGAVLRRSTSLPFSVTRAVPGSVTIALG